MEQHEIKAIRAVDLLDTEFPTNYSYINPAILTKGGTLLLGGLAKIGKSLMMLEIVRAVTNKKPLFDWEPFSVDETARCLYIESENGLRATKERAVQIFAKEDRDLWKDNFYLVSSEPMLLLDTVSGKRNFLALIKDVRPNVLLLDPISLLHNGEENSNKDIGQIYHTINQMKQYGKEFNMSVVLAHHFGKPPWGKAREGYDPLSEYNFRGASKWKDGADSMITAHRYTNLDKKWEAWKLKLRFTTRHGSPPAEMSILVNKDNDLRMAVGEPYRPIVEVDHPQTVQSEFEFPSVLYRTPVFTDFNKVIL